MSRPELIAPGQEHNNDLFSDNPKVVRQEFVPCGQTIKVQLYCNVPMCQRKIIQQKPP